MYCILNKKKKLCKRMKDEKFFKNIYIYKGRRRKKERKKMYRSI